MPSLEDFAGEWGASFLKMYWKDEGLRDGLNNGHKRMESKLMALMERYAPEVENWMKDNAPWTDKTGNARNGLATRAFQQGRTIGIVLYHQVPYGIFLETRFSGKYGIIIPAMDYWGDRIIGEAKTLMKEI